MDDPDDLSTLPLNELFALDDVQRKERQRRLRQFERRQPEKQKPVHRSTDAELAEQMQRFVLDHLDALAEEIGTQTGATARELRQAVTRIDGELAALRAALDEMTRAAKANRDADSNVVAIRKDNPDAAA